MTGSNSFTLVQAAGYTGRQMLSWNMVCCIWNGQVETSALSHLNRTAWLTHSLSEIRFRWSSSPVSLKQLVCQRLSKWADPWTGVHWHGRRKEKASAEVVLMRDRQIGIWCFTLKGCLFRRYLVFYIKGRGLFCRYLVFYIKGRSFLYSFTVPVGAGCGGGMKRLSCLRQIQTARKKEQEQGTRHKWKGTHSVAACPPRQPQSHSRRTRSSRSRPHLQPQPAVMDLKGRSMSPHRFSVTSYRQ